MKDKRSAPLCSGFHDLESTINDGRLFFNGFYALDGVKFAFRCNETGSGDHPLRGKLRIISRETGFTLMTLGDPPKKIECSIYPSPRDLHDRSNWLDAVEERVAEAALTLLGKHLTEIKRDAELTVTPETVTPQMAVLLYADKFFRDCHRKASDKLLDDHRSTLRSVFSRFDNKPMSTFSRKDGKAVMDAIQLNANKARLIWSFWDYCLVSGLCTGTNPISKPLPKRQSAAAAQAKADRLDILDLATQAALYLLLLAKPDARACGVALMLWGGFSAAEACKFRWRDLLMLSKDFVAVKHHKSQNAGATHNYTRVLFIQAARILFLRYRKLMETYTHNQILDLPIVSPVHDAKRVLKPNLLNQYGRELLTQCGVDQQILRASEEWHQAVAARIFINTYASNLIHSCGLDPNSGLYRFMCGKPLTGIVTQDHYNSFSYDGGLETQYAAVRRMAPEEIIESVPVDTSHDGYDIYTLTPETTRDHLGFSVAIPGLHDGDFVGIVNEYGTLLQAKAQ